MVAPGAVYDIKISDTLTIPKRWLRGLLSHFAYARHLTHTKISDALNIKKR